MAASRLHDRPRVEQEKRDPVPPLISPAIRAHGKPASQHPADDPGLHPRHRPRGLDHRAPEPSALALKPSLILVLERTPPNLLPERSPGSTVSLMHAARSSRLDERRLS